MSASHQRRSCDPPTMRKRGGSRRSLLHTGHLDGLLSRARSLKTNPQTRHLAGSTRKRAPLCLSERARCSRWPATSFSLIPTRAESSRAASGPSRSTCLSSERTLTRRSVSSFERDFFANGLPNWENDGRRRGAPYEYVKALVSRGGIEPPTPCLKGRCSTC